jgi:aryl-alcohol dehydrogenase-like predicted oxidoreductase
MRYRLLGRSGFEISDIGHGLWGMGSWTGSDDQRSLESLQLSLDFGCNFFDSAWAYGEGRSDRLLGELIARNPGKRIVVASKVPPLNRVWPADQRDLLMEVFPRDHVIRHAELIREAMRVETIDLLQYHVWDDSWAAQPEFREVVEELKSKRYIRSFGLSLNRWQPENGLAAIRTGLVDTVQAIYNIFDQSPEDQLFPLCRELKVGVIARVPLDEGSLGGKLTADTRFPEGDWRARYFNPRNLKATLRRVDKLKQQLPDGMTLSELAFRFILSNPDVSTTIPGMRDAGHIRANLSYSDKGPLPADQLAELKQHRWDRKPKTWSA